jgi:exopolysaccharide transport family protein
MEKIREEQIDIREYLHIISRRRWTIITTFALIVVSTAIFTFTAAPVYEATTRLIIEKENPNVVSVQEVMAVDASGTDYYQTQYKIMESRSVARKVIQRLQLDKSEEFFPQPADNLFARFFRAIKDTIRSWFDAMSGLFKKDSGSVQSPNDSPDHELVTAFIKRIRIEPIRNSRLVDVRFQAEDPVLAARIAHTLAEAYIGQNLETKLDAVQDAVKWLHNRIALERTKVEKAEKALLEYKEQHNIVTDFSSDTEKITAQKLAQLNTQVVEAESARVEAETRYTQSRDLSSTPDMLDSIPEVLNNELIRQMKTMEVELYKRMSELSKKYGAKHPQMIAIKSELRTLQKRKKTEISRVVNSLKNEYEVAQARENSLKAALAKQKQELLDLNQKAISYGVLRREAESAREMYELLIKRFKETTLTEDMRTGNIRIVDQAEVPRRPVKPNKSLNLALAVVLGLFFSLGMAFFFEYLDNTIKNADDIKRYLKIPFLGPVPALALDNPQETQRNVRPELVTLNTPKSIASEAYRGIRTDILFSAPDAEPRIILVSSAGPQEGKTLTVTNLAVTMAQAGSRVIVLDCDLRRPRLHKLFRINENPGLTNLLIGDHKLKLEALATGISNLYLIPSGSIPPNPSELLGSRRMDELLKTLLNKFNRIIIDSPPIGAVTDAAVLSKYTDGVVYVLRANATVRGAAINGLEQFKQVGANVLGAVLNGVDFERDKYYYSHYSYYYYGQGSDKPRKSRRKKDDLTFLHAKA